MFPIGTTLADIEKMKKHQEWIRNKGWLKEKPVEKPKVEIEPVEESIQDDPEIDFENESDGFMKKKKKKDR